MKRLGAWAVTTLILLALAFALSCGGSASKGTWTATATRYYAVADSNNSRVLIYDAPFTTNQNASLVLGRTDFAQGGAEPAATQSSLAFPTAVTFDSGGNLWVADTDHRRVMEFVPPFANTMSASLVLGEPSFTSVSTGVSQSQFTSPQGVAVDRNGDVWVSDPFASRVLEFTPPFSNGMNASLVLGQPDFTTSNRTTSANGLRYPGGLAFDPNGNLWVADTYNNRVLQYTPPFANGMNATLVIGQTDFISNLNATTQSGLWNPAGVSFDAKGNLWVADYWNGRVLEYVPPFTSGMAATLVLGQPDYVKRNWAATANGASTPSGLAFDSAGRILVSDRLNNRVVIYQPPFSNGMNAATVIGQPDFNSSSANQGNANPGANSLSWPLLGTTF
jgi:sugar lactone lactonase YvrE